jgi:glycosyltransferase involved in cell wall biosynthesis
MRTEDRPLFSVIIPTRDRSSSCAVALQSVLDQRFDKFEVIVVNDGSSEEHERRYRESLTAASGIARILTLPRTEKGHGPGGARNYGAAAAQGAYLAFLDDDDQWIDPSHLDRVAREIAASAEPIELVFANQRAFCDGAPVDGATWIEDLARRLAQTPDRTGAYTVTAAELSACPAHCHLNATIVSRRFFDDIGGLDESLRYEEDRDFYLRAIDHARLIRYFPSVVSQHNIPDPVGKSSASTAETELSKRLYQLRVFDKAVLFSTRRELRRYAMRERTYVLKHIATEAAATGRFDCAAYYGRQALMARFTFGWLAATAWFELRRHFADNFAQNRSRTAGLGKCKPGSAASTSRRS